MRSILGALVKLLQLERIEQTIFRGQSQDLGWGNIFGGQVLGQALSAAQQTVPEPRTVHSLHAYFLRTGDASLPVIYEVDPIRDGKSFTTRRVVAIQNGRAIFNMAASFQVPEEGFEHESEMPDVPGPEERMSEVDIARKFADAIPEKFRARVTADKPIELRPVEFYNPLAPKAGPPSRHVWMKAVDALPDDPQIHRFLLAYASDFHFMPTSMQPHAVSYMTKGMQVASLDHAMWFHRPFRMDEWLLHAIDSPTASGARGFARGRVFTRDGTLVASTAQEGLIRKWD